MYEILKGIEIPRPPSAPTYPFDRMEIGDCFVVTPHEVHAVLEAYIKRWQQDGKAGKFRHYTINGVPHIFRVE